MALRFVKMEGAGNDFVLLDARHLERDWPRLASALCDRHFGVGADGLLLLLLSQKADFRIRIFNADGSEAETCGNGLRCLVKYVLDRRLAAGPGVTVETLAGVVRATATVEDGRVESVRVGMGRPRFASAEIPVKLPRRSPKVDIIKDCPVKIAGRQLYLTCLSMGNPHAVAFIEEPVEAFPLEHVGPRVEHHRLFPARVNFEVVNLLGEGRLTRNQCHSERSEESGDSSSPQFIGAPQNDINRQPLGQGKARARVWERGVGETLACGSGACAIAVAAHLRGQRGPIDITLPGGTLTLEWDGQGQVYLSGPAREVFQGEWPE